MLMHVRPCEATAIDGLVGIGGDKDAIGFIAQTHQQPQRAWVKVLRFVNHHCVIGETNFTLCHAFLCQSSCLVPCFLALLFQQLPKGLMHLPDCLSLECVQ